MCTATKRLHMHIHVCSVHIHMHIHIHTVWLTPRVHLSVQCLFNLLHIGKQKTCFLYKRSVLWQTSWNPQETVITMMTVFSWSRSVSALFMCKLILTYFYVFCWARGEILEPRTHADIKSICTLFGNACQDCHLISCQTLNPWNKMPSFHCQLELKKKKNGPFPFWSSTFSSQLKCINHPLVQFLPSVAR